MTPTTSGTSVHLPTVLTRLRSINETTGWVLAGIALAVVVGVPMVVSGPGNDLDVGNVFRAGRSIMDLDYEPSRAPGAPVHEAIVGVLDRIGGPLLTNLASAVAALALVIGLDLLLAREGLSSKRRWAIALVVANPWFLIAATSTIDYVLALTLVVWSALLLRNGHLVWSGVMAGLAMGSRVGSIVLIAAMLLAELTDTWALSRDRVRSWPWRRVVVAGAVMAATTVVLFVPSFVEAGGFAFAQNDFTTSTPLVMLGRAAAKILALLGPVASVVALLALPAMARSLARWRTSWLIRFAAPGLVLSTALFLRFPWKVPHLLPVLLCGAILLGVALHRRPILLVVLVGLQLLYGVVGIDVIRPDSPNQAGSGHPTLSVSWGPVVTDWQCRREDPDAYLGEQLVEIEAAWNCARPFGD